MTDPSAASRRGPFAITSSQEVYENPWIHVREDRVIRDAVGVGLFGVVTLKPGSTVLAIDDERHVYLAREFKYALGAESLELVSGGIDDGETPQQAAARELREELGLAAAEWSELGVTHPFTTVIDSPNYMFAARGLTRVAAEDDAWEQLEMVRLPLAEAQRMAMAGEILHAASAICLLKSIVLEY